MDLIQDSYISFVNLDSREDRLNHMTNQLNRIGLRAIRQRGIPWKETDFENPKYATMKNRTPGAIGCHLSQVEIMKKALSVKSHAWVMEDDLIFCQDFNERISYMGDFLEGRAWDIVWLGSTFHSPAFWHPKGNSGMQPNCSQNIGRDFETTEDSRMMRTYGAFCTYAYIVNKDSIQKVIDLLDADIHTSIGIDYAMIRIQPQLNCFAFVPGSVKQMDNQSDIGTGMTIFSGFSRLNGTEENSRYWYQDYAIDFDPKKFDWK